jgi:hypothetical protein
MKGLINRFIGVLTSNVIFDLIPVSPNTAGLDKILLGRERYESMLKITK